MLSSTSQSSEFNCNNYDMLIDLCMTYATRFQLTLTTTKPTLLFDPNPEPYPLPNPYLLLLSHSMQDLRSISSNLSQLTYPQQY